MSLNYILDLPPYDQEAADWVNLLANRIRCNSIESENIDFNDVTVTTLNTTNINNQQKIETDILKATTINSTTINNVDIITSNILDCVESRSTFDKTSILTATLRIETPLIQCSSTTRSPNIESTIKIDSKVINNTESITTNDLTVNNDLFSIGNIIGYRIDASETIRSANGYFFGSSPSSEFRLSTYYSLKYNCINIVGLITPNFATAVLQRVGNISTLIITATNTLGELVFESVTETAEIRLASLGPAIGTRLINDLINRTEIRCSGVLRRVFGIPVSYEYLTVYMTIIPTAAPFPIIELRLANNAPFNNTMRMAELTLTYQNTL